MSSVALKEQSNGPDNVIAPSVFGFDPKLVTKGQDISTAAAILLMFLSVFFLSVISEFLNFLKKC